MEIAEQNAETRPRGPAERMCVGCAKVAPVASLVRLVLVPSASSSEPSAVVVDLANSSFGRGAHVHGTRECIQRAVRGGLSKSFKRAVTGDLAQICSEIRNAAQRRIVGLLGGAKRAGLVKAGADVTVEAMASGAPLVVVATDAGSIVGHSVIRGAVASGKAVAISNKKTLGVIAGRDETAVLAVLNDGIAREIQRVYGLMVAVQGPSDVKLEV